MTLRYAPLHIASQLALCKVASTVPLDTHQTAKLCFWLELVCTKPSGLAQVSREVATELAQVMEQACQVGLNKLEGVIFMADPVPICCQKIPA